MSNVIDLSSDKDIRFLGFEEIDGVELFNMSISQIHKKLGVVQNRRQAKSTAMGSVVLFEIFENTYSGESLSYLIRCDQNKLIIDQCHSYHKFILSGVVRVRKNDVSRKILKPELDYTGEDLKMISDFFKAGGAQYILNKVKEFEKMDAVSKAKYTSRNFLILDHQVSFRVVG